MRDQGLEDGRGEGHTQGKGVEWHCASLEEVKMTRTHG